MLKAVQGHGGSKLPTDWLVPVILLFTEAGDRHGDELS